ncbi:MAG TPA: hypothetical protein VHU19_15880 [Pyrinomonadaceae bacterium]|nr:hypothetical protein [Pyrinomonadaceae bacterium]
MNIPELSEVLIEGERLLDAEAFDDDFARAVGEAPVFAIESPEDFSRASTAGT